MTSSWRQVAVRETPGLKQDTGVKADAEIKADNGEIKGEVDVDKK